MSQNQLQKLGKRLKESVSATDLRLLDEYRRSFRAASEALAETVYACTGFAASQRPAKSTQAILEKLRRQTTHLGQIQDIAGCRITVPDVSAQAKAVRALQDRFPEGVIKDRRVVPSHGYRAVHLVVKHEGCRIEIQVRTALQNQWALLSERMADWYGNAIKYGGGPESIQELLQDASHSVAEVERFESELARELYEIPSEVVVNSPPERQSSARAEERLIRARQRLSDLLLSIPDRLDHP
ncbi:hypothetical protein [Roseateles sp.]|uniref:hypothetical protein n=1 Tax=Roseateles sp. TaxID=1971397 RepID=UPI0031DDEB56